MEEPFSIPVVYKGAALQFEAHLQQRGYTYALHVAIFETMVIFERDEEGNWRALMPVEEKGKVSAAKGKVPDTELLQVLITVLEEMFE